MCKYCPPTRGGVHLIQEDHSISISRAPFLRPLSSHCSEAALDSSGWDDSKLVFSEGYRKLPGISLSPEKTSTWANDSFSRQCPDEGRGDTHTQVPGQ